VSAALAAFLSTFVSVFALGLQSLNVNQRMYVAAALTSVAISSGHIWLYKVMPTATGWDVGGYYLGGIAGITASIWFHARAKAWLAACWPRWKQEFFALFASRTRAGQTPPRRNPPPPCCGRCGDEYQFPCWRVDCPRHEG
jgi:hypothetical protein